MYPSIIARSRRCIAKPAVQLQQYLLTLLINIPCTNQTCVLDSVILSLGGSTNIGLFLPLRNLLWFQYIIRCEDPRKHQGDQVYDSLTPPPHRDYKVWIMLHGKRLDHYTVVQSLQRHAAKLRPYNDCHRLLYDGCCRTSKGQRQPQKCPAGTSHRVMMILFCSSRGSSPAILEMPRECEIESCFWMAWVYREESFWYREESQWRPFFKQHNNVCVTVYIIFCSIFSIFLIHP